jgi:hypothetical protein
MLNDAMTKEYPMTKAQETALRRWRSTSRIFQLVACSFLGHCVIGPWSLIRQ